MSCLGQKRTLQMPSLVLVNSFLRAKQSQFFLEPYVDVVVPVPLLALAAVHHVHVHDLQLLGSFGRVRIHRTPPC